jgi:ATP-dependent helicase/nuclease subunit A
MSGDDATRVQVRAAEPGVSTWLSANAGSGKTRVLIDRVVRLLMAGTPPSRILCLTYTKAAAAEMQNRLFQRLGSWAMMPADALRQALAALGHDARPDDAALAAARRLFAHAIETPGGLKVQTIHSFCAALLRRFPLEAGVSPRFSELDEGTARALAEAVTEAVAARIAPEATAALAAHHSGEALDETVRAILAGRAGLAPGFDREALCRSLGLSPGVAERDVIAAVFRDGEAEWLPRAAAALLLGATTDARCGTRLAKIDPHSPTLRDVAALEDALLTGAKAAQPYSAKTDAIPTKKGKAPLEPALRDRLHALMRRVEAARQTRLGFEAVRRAEALAGFAAALLPEYERGKAERGALDFDDLVTRAAALLHDPSVAQWVLYRLDGGIDHILVDEAQDTSPAQWQVIERLADEFMAGRGARDGARTVFVVGDRKQSIYSFQGADLEAFEAVNAGFARRLGAAGTPLQQMELRHSFRSSAAILKAVDLTFDPRGGFGLGAPVDHVAFHDAMPGRVDLWPAVGKAPAPEPGEWTDPVDLPGNQHHAVQLADRLAGWLTELFAAGTLLPGGRAGAGPRPAGPGDVLVLVQRRSTLFHALIRAFKARGLPVAGSDRIRLGDEIAVRDLMALLAFLATPEDDLSLAAALRSPLFGWTEAALHDLAAGRPGYLWAALRERPDHAETRAILTDLRDRVDFLRPHELLDRMLARHGGRRRLVARLGPECEEAIDLLLTRALAYEREAVPDLTGFLTWLKPETVEIRRQADARGGQIRVMTVHGAKGLEAPIVILPDTARRDEPTPGPLLRLPDGRAIWRPLSPLPDALAAAAADEAARREAESRRLLYVAMTRAECWLIVAAAGETGDGTAWHDRVRAGLEAAGTVALDTPAGPGLRHARGNWPEPAGGGAPRGAPAAAGPALPDWAGRPAAPAAAPAAPLSPSDLGGAKVLAGDASGGDALARRRGILLHALLEAAPDTATPPWPAGDSVAEGLADEVRALRADPVIGALLARPALTEVAVTATLPGGAMLGTIDRLIVEPDRVLAIDYKSHGLVPDRPEAVPEGILRQMGAYAAALEQIYPGRSVETALLWTGARRLMPLPRPLLTAALERASPA